MNISNYRKFIVAIVGAILAWAAAVIASPEARITASEWLVLATGLATSLGVYGVRNDPK